MGDRSKQRHWWKCPDGLYRDSKLRSLKPSAQLALVWLRCLESEGFFADDDFSMQNLAWTLHVPERAFKRDLDDLRAAGYVGEDGRPVVEEAAPEAGKSDSGRQDEKRFMDALKKYLSQFLVRDLSRTEEELSRDKNLSVRDEKDSVTPRAREEQNRTEQNKNPPSPHGGPGVTDSSAKFIYPMTEAEAASVGRLVAGWPGIGGVATPGVRGAFCAAHRVFGLDAEDLLAAVEEQKSHGWFSGEKKMPRLEKWIADRYWGTEFVQADDSDAKKSAAASARWSVPDSAEERYGSEVTEIPAAADQPSAGA